MYTYMCIQCTCMYMYYTQLTNTHTHTYTQYAIVFQTPPFYNLAIERPVQVNISLRRPSDQETSEPKPFLFLPQEFGEFYYRSFYIHVHTCTLGSHELGSIIYFSLHVYMCVYITFISLFLSLSLSHSLMCVCV